jgi:hypothetical protein
MSVYYTFHTLFILVLTITIKYSATIGGTNNILTKQPETQ